MGSKKKVTPCTFDGAAKMIEGYHDVAIKFGGEIKVSPVDDGQGTADVLISINEKDVAHLTGVRREHLELILDGLGLQ